MASVPPARSRQLTCEGLCSRRAEAHNFSTMSPKKNVVMKGDGKKKDERAPSFFANGTSLATQRGPCSLFMCHSNVLVVWMPFIYGIVCGRVFCFPSRAIFCVGCPAYTGSRGVVFASLFVVRFEFLVAVGMSLLAPSSFLQCNLHLGLFLFVFL